MCTRWKKLWFLFYPPSSPSWELFADSPQTSSTLRSVAACSQARTHDMTTWHVIAPCHIAFGKSLWMEQALEDMQRQQVFGLILSKGQHKYSGECPPTYLDFMLQVSTKQVSQLSIKLPSKLPSLGRVVFHVSSFFRYLTPPPKSRHIRLHETSPRMSRVADLPNPESTFVEDTHPTWPSGPSTWHASMVSILL